MKNSGSILRIALFCCGALSLSASGADKAKTIIVPSPNAETISIAMMRAQSGDTVVVKPGLYRERVMVTYGVSLVSPKLHGATINGNGGGNVVTMGRGATLDGFIIRNGAVGVYNANIGNVIRQCIIEENYQCGIMCIGAVAIIEDNIIRANRTSGIYCAYIDENAGAVWHNTIIENRGDGVRLLETPPLAISANIIALNTKRGVHANDELVEYVLKNNFYGNYMFWSKAPKENFSFNPRLKDYRCTASHPEAQCCGARLHSVQ